MLMDYQNFVGLLGHYIMGNTITMYVGSLLCYMHIVHVLVWEHEFMAISKGNPGNPITLIIKQ